MTVPFDTAIGPSQLINCKIIPDKEIGKDGLSLIREIKKILVGGPADPAPLGGIFKVEIIAVIDIFNRCKETGISDPGLTKQRGDAVEWQMRTLYAAVNMTVNDPFRTHACLLSAPYNPVSTCFLRTFSCCVEKKNSVKPGFSYLFVSLNNPAADNSPAHATTVFSNLLPGTGALFGEIFFFDHNDFVKKQVRSYRPPLPQ